MPPAGGVDFGVPGDANLFWGVKNFSADRGPRNISKNFVLRVKKIFSMYMMYMYMFSRHYAAQVCSMIRFCMSL